MAISDDDIREIVKEMGQEYELKKKKPKSDSGSKIMLLFIFFLSILNTLGIGLIIFLIRR